MHVDLHVELRLIKNSRPADSAPYFTRIAGISFNWRNPRRKISKVVDPRDTKVLFVPFGGVLENQYRLNYLGRVGDLEFAESRA